MKILMVIVFCYCVVAGFLNRQAEWDRYIVSGDPKRRP
jgi:hypothetical protein